MRGPEVNLNAGVGTWIDRNGNTFAEGWDARPASDGEICGGRRIEMGLRSRQSQTTARRSWSATVPQGERTGVWTYRISLLTDGRGDRLPGKT